LNDFASFIESVCRRTTKITTDLLARILKEEFQEKIKMLYM